MRGGDEGADDLDLEMDLDLGDDDALVLEDDGPTEVDLAAEAKPKRASRASASAGAGSRLSCSTRRTARRPVSAAVVPLRAPAGMSSRNSSVVKFAV